MAEFTITITIGRGAKARTHTATVDSQDMPLILMEAGERETAREMREALAEYLELPDDFARRLTVRHLQEVSEQIASVTKIPNGQKPPST